MTSLAPPEPDATAPADGCADARADTTADDCAASPLPAELGTDQRHGGEHGGQCWWRHPARPGPRPPQQETSYWALGGLLRHWSPAVGIPGEGLRSEPD